MKCLPKINFRGFKLQTILTLAVAFCVGAGGSAMAFEVWMGTHVMTSRLSTESTSWARTAAWVDGVNFNIAPNRANPATFAQRKDVIRRINHVDHTIVGVPRSAVSRTNVDEASRASIIDRIDSLLRTAARDGAPLNEFMLYDERSDGVLYLWTETELQIFREELDNQGQQDARIIWRATNNAARNLNFASLPIIEGLLIEASADRFINNRFNVNTLAQSFWNRSVNSDKELYMQIPRSENSQTQYEATREAVIEMRNWIGIEGVRSDRLIVMPVTYNENIEQLPETINNGNAYPNTMPGIWLSLIEQRPYFEGRLGPLPSNFAASTERFERPTYIASETDGSLRRHKGNNAVDGANLGFVVNNSNLEVGQTGNAPYDRAAVIPFRLPDYGDVDNPFLAVNLEGFLTQTTTQNGVTADLYGLGRRPTPEILDSDYYGLSGTPDPSATLLQMDLLVSDMDLNAPFYSNSGGNKNLLAFLNDQYAGGEGADEYVFLRVNTSGDSNQRWVFASGNHESESRRPKLRYTLDFAVEEVGPPSTLVVGWDNFDNASAPTATSVGVGVTATASVTGPGWSNNDGSGRGSSKDTTWGTFEGPAAADAGTTAVGVNLTLTNGAATGDLTFTITNGGAADLDLKSFHMDALAFRPNAARTYALNVLSGDMTIGNVFTSADDAITHLAGNLLTDDADPLAHDQHDDIEIGMSGLADHTLAVGESAVIQIAFAGGTGGGGHHLFIDNLAFSGILKESTVLLGDVDLSGEVNFLDISPFITVLSGGTFQAEADCDQSGAVNFLDISPFIAILSGS